MMDVRSVDSDASVSALLRTAESLIAPDACSGGSMPAATVAAAALVDASSVGDSGCGAVSHVVTSSAVAAAA